METSLVSFDLGNGFCKVVSASGRICYSSVWSVLSKQLEGFEMPSFAPNHDFVIRFDDKEYAVGETVRSKGLTPVTIAHRSRIGTEFYRVLFASALAASIKRSAEIHVVLSLPPAAYWDKERLKQAISGNYEVGVPIGGRFVTLNYSVQLENIRVIPEGVGALWTFILDRSGKVKDSRYKEMVVGVVDVGTYTTDLVQLDHLKIVRSGCDSLPHALHDIHDKLRQYASSLGYELDMWRADEVLQRGYFTIGRDRIYIEDRREEWAKELTQAISGLIRTRWNGANDVEEIVTVGGGEPLVFPFLFQEFDHCSAVTEIEPHLANAEGGYRYGLLREHQ